MSDDDGDALRAQAAEQLVSALRDTTLKPADVLAVTERYMQAFELDEPPQGDLLRALLFGFGYGRGYSDGVRAGRRHGA